MRHSTSVNVVIAMNHQSRFQGKVFSSKSSLTQATRNRVGPPAKEDSKKTERVVETPRRSTNSDRRRTIIQGPVARRFTKLKKETPKTRLRRQEYTLDPIQESHIQEILGILLNCKAAIDVSVMGTGKTLMTCEVVSRLKAFALILCPLAALGSWYQWSSNVGIDCEIISYTQFRSVTGFQPKHGLIKRVLTDNGTKYVCTDAFKDMFSENKPFLLILDECQAIKNSCGIAKSVMSLVNQVDISENSRVLCISGTPIDKIPQARNLLNICCLLGEGPLIIQSSSEIRMSPELEDFLEVCQLYDEKVTTQLEDKYYEDLKNMSKGYKVRTYELIMDLLREVISEKIARGIPRPITDFRCRYYNGFFQSQDPEVRQKLHEKISELNDLTLNVNGERSRKGNLQRTNLLARKIEDLKVEDVPRIVIQELESNPKCKVCIAVENVNSVHILRRALKKYGALAIFGNVKAEEREERIAKFQEPNLDKRVIIFTLKTGGQAISLHDTDGNFPRVMFIVSTFSTMLLVQCTHRIFRHHTMSDAKIIVYYAHGIDEVRTTKIQKSKCITLRCLVNQASMEGRKYPDDSYGSLTEEVLGEPLVEKIEGEPINEEKPFREEVSDEETDEEEDDIE